MPCTATAIVHGSSPAVSDVAKEHLRGPQDGIRRSGSGTGLVGMQRLRSEPQLWCSLSFPRPATAASAPAKLKTSHSVGPFSFIPNSIAFVGPFSFIHHRRADSGSHPIQTTFPSSLRDRFCSPQIETLYLLPSVIPSPSLHPSSARGFRLSFVSIERRILVEKKAPSISIR